MTPKQKAQELVKKFDELLPCEGMTTGQTPIDCAIIAVDEIIKDYNYDCFSTIFWNEVKQEIIKLQHA